MEFYITDSNRMELMSLPDGATVDFDLGDTNDAEMVCSWSDGIEKGMYLICPGTEYGAILEETEEDTSAENITWRGDAFRKFLSQFIIEPDGDYKIVSGDANDIIRDILGDAFGGMFNITGSAGITISNYQFERYVDALTGFTAMLKEVDARININIVQGGPNEPFEVELSAVPIQNREKEIEYSQDSDIQVILTDSKRGITHLICLGQGELSERMVRHLYLQADGTVGTKQYYVGLNERTDIYDYPNAEDEDALILGGTERLLEEAPFQKVEMSASGDEDMPIGDIISGRNYMTGLHISKPIIGKIAKSESGFTSIEYKVEGSE